MLTVLSPGACSTSSARRGGVTCAAPNGAPMVAMAVTSGSSAAAASAAAPPRLCPTSRPGAACPSARAWAAATRSRADPSLWPRPVQSKRRTAMPLLVSARATRTAAAEFSMPVKQCANSAYACTGPSGKSRQPESRWPCAPTKSIRSLLIAAPSGGRSAKGRRDGDTALQRQCDGRLLGHLAEPRALLGRELALQHQGAIDARLVAVLDEAQVDVEALQPPALALGIHAKRDRRARRQRGP